jgi:chromosome segregation ATPase
VADDIFGRLEERVNRLLQVLAGLREENEQLRSELRDKEGRIQELEIERQNLSNSVGSLQSGSEEQERKLHAVTEQLEGLIVKLESVG